MNPVREKNILWSSEINIDDWREDIIYELGADCTEADIYEEAEERNRLDLDDMRENLNIQMDNQIIVIGDLGLWNGRVTGYKMIESGNLKDCFVTQCSGMSEITWFIDTDGNLRASESHHDGTNYYLYRVVKQDVSETELNDFQAKIYDAQMTAEDLEKYTASLGDTVAKVYGF